MKLANISGAKSVLLLPPKSQLNLLEAASS